MEIRKGYKWTEVGVVPEEWEVVNIAKISNQVTDGEHITPRRSKIGIYLLSARNILNGSLAIDDVDFVDENEYERITKRCNPESGDVLISCSGTIGRVTVVPDGIKCVLVRSAALIKQNREKVNGYFIQHFLQSYIGQEQIQRSINMGAQPNLFLNHINALKIPLPPQSEQTAIATALTDMDKLISGLEGLLAKKRAVKQGAMGELLKGKDGWEVKRLGEVLKVRHGKRQNEVEDTDGDYPILASGGVIGRANRFLYDKPAVLIGRKGTIDKPQYMDTPFWTIDTLFYCEILEGYDAKYIYYLFNMINWYDYNEASGVPSLNAKTIEQIEKLFPKTKEEQEAIADVLTAMDKEIETLTESLGKYRRVKAGMMGELLTGRVRLV